MVLLYRENPYCSRHKKREASGSVRQTLLPFLLPSALHILCHCHLLRRLPIPLCNLRLFAAQLCQDGRPAILTFGGHIIPPAVNHVVILFFIYLGTAEILPILHISLPVFKRRLIHSPPAHPQTVSIPAMPAYMTAFLPEGCGRLESRLHRNCPIQQEGSKIKLPDHPFFLTGAKNPFYCLCQSISLLLYFVIILASLSACLLSPFSSRLLPVAAFL